MVGKYLISYTVLLFTRKRGRRAQDPQSSLFSLVDLAILKTNIFAS